MRKFNYTKEQLETIVAQSTTKRQVLIATGRNPYSGSYTTLNRYLKLWNINTSHLLSSGEQSAKKGINNSRPLEEILTKDSQYSRGSLKKRLYSSGLKTKFCELCGQGEYWNGKKMSLILDHKNGIRNDNCLENLQIVCPNCNATLDTHCSKVLAFLSPCLTCGNQKSAKRKYCNRNCWTNRSPVDKHKPKLRSRKVLRPTYEELRQELQKSNYSALGRKYGVSDNAIRKWLKYYEKEMAPAQGFQP